MRALVLGGAGAVCRETTRDLAATSDFDEIVVADYNLDAASELVDSVGDSRLSPLHLDAGDEAALREHFPAYDVIVNGLPYRFDYTVTKVCVETGVSGLDLSSEESQFALDDNAREKDIVFVPGVGATPGITNVMVRRAAEILERLDEVDVSFAAFRCLAPAPGLLQTTLWEFNPEVGERRAVYYENGEWHPAAPLSGEKRIRFHDQIGEQAVYYVPHNEAATLPVSFPSVKRVAVRGCFPPVVMELMGALMRGGLLTSEPVQVGETSVEAIELVRSLLMDSPVSRENRVWAYGLVVEVMGRRDGRRVRCIYRNRHPAQEEWGGEAAYFKNVGIPLSIGAQMIARGEISRKGVTAPEAAFPTAVFFAELAQRGIQIDETIIEEGPLTV